MTWKYRNLGERWQLYGHSAICEMTSLQTCNKTDSDKTIASSILVPSDPLVFPKFPVRSTCTPWFCGFDFNGQAFYGFPKQGETLVSPQGLFCFTTASWMPNSIIWPALNFCTSAFVRMKKFIGSVWNIYKSIHKETFVLKQRWGSSCSISTSCGYNSKGST